MPYSSTIPEEELKNRIARDVFGAFDAEKIAFLPYHEVVDLFYQNDFNWNVPPSDASTREFRLLLDRVRPLLAQGMRVFRFDGDASDLAAFVRRHLKDGQTAHRFFWNRYRRPPKKEYWGYISERRDRHPVPYSVPPCHQRAHSQDRAQAPPRRSRRRDDGNHRCGDGREG